MTHASMHQMNLRWAKHRHLDLLELGMPERQCKHNPYLRSPRHDARLTMSIVMCDASMITRTSLLAAIITWQTFVSDGLYSYSLVSRRCVTYSIRITDNIDCRHSRRRCAFRPNLDHCLFVNCLLHIHGGGMHVRRRGGERNGGGDEGK